MDVDQQLAPPVVGVVVVHDPGDWFADSLRALRMQDYPNLRWLFLITSDDPEGTLAAQITAEIPDAFVRLAATTAGFGAAANEVLDLVEGEQGFFWICHDDIAPARNALRELVTELYRSNAGMVGPKLVEWDDPRRLQHVGLGVDRFGEVDPVVEPGELDQEQHDAVRDVFVLPSACVLIRADLFRSLGGFDPAINFHGDDVDLCWRAHLSGARVVVAPEARVRHREELESRRPDLDHRGLRARHRMRAVAVLTGASRLLVRSIQMVVVTIVELIAGLFTGRFGEALASLRALLGLVVRTGSLISRRRVVRPQRKVPEREVLGLQVRGSARLTSYVRGRETTTYVGIGSTVRRWRTTSFAPLLAWFGVLVALVIGARTFIDRGVPQIGEFLPFPESPRGLVDAYLSSWDWRAGGSTSPAPTGWMSLALLSVLAGFRMDLAMTMSIIGMVVVGAAGTWRLAAVFPATGARVAALVVYVGTPLVPGVMATGRWSTLVWYAALPWAVHLLRRLAGIGTADPALADLDLVDGLADLTRRERLRYLALLTLVLGVAAAFVPVTVVLWFVVGVVVVVATLLVGGSIHTAGWFTIGTVGGVIGAVLLNLPWATTWTWATMVPVPQAGAAGAGLVEVATFSFGDRSFVVLAVGFYVAVIASVAITRAWRLTWAVRGAGLVLVFGAAAVFADRGDLPIDPPELSLLMVPVALGLALSAAAIAGGFGHDVVGRGFGWRQPLALVANLAIVIALVPALVSIGNGSFGAPRTTLATLLAAQLPADPAEGDYRVLYVGDPRVLPVPAFEQVDGVAFALVDDGALSFTDRWSAPETEAVTALSSALDRIAEGSTLRGGRLLAPLGVRFIVVPEIDGAASTASSPLPLPSGLLDALRDQLDLGQTFGAPGITVFVNRSWLPVTALADGPAAQASNVATEAELVRAELSGVVPAFPGLDALTPQAATLGPSVLHLGTPFDDRWWLELDGQRQPARLGFGLTTAFDLGDGGAARVGYDRAGERMVWVIAQVLLWLTALAAASRATIGRSRRRVIVETDETLIDLDESGAPVADPALEIADIGLRWGADTVQTGVIGEVLAPFVDERGEDRGSPASEEPR